MVLVKVVSQKQKNDDITIKSCGKNKAPKPRAVGSKPTAPAKDLVRKDGVFFLSGDRGVGKGASPCGSGDPARVGTAFARYG